MTGEKIIIVEDDRIMASYLQEVLEKEGYLVPTMVGSGQKAIEEAERLMPDLVLMDISLRGEMNGVEAAQEIRARLDLPVIFLTALSDQATLEKAAQVSPYGYIVKPFQEKTLFINITIALYKHRLEQAVRLSEERFRGIFEASPIGIEIFDERGKMQLYNAATRLIFGLVEPADFSAYNLFSDPNLSPEVLQRIRRGETVRYSAEFDFEKVREQKLYRTARSGMMYLDTVVTPLRKKSSEVSSYLVQMQETTERVLAEQALRESERTFRSLVEQAHDGIIITDEQGRVIEWNRALEDISAYAHEEMLGQYIWDAQFRLMLPESRTAEVYDRMKRDFISFLQTGQLFNMGSIREQEYMRKDGIRRTLQTLIYPIETDKGYMSSTQLRDVTLQKAAEQALRESEERLSLVMDGSNDGFWDWNALTGQVFHSRRWAEMLGFSPAEIESTMQGWERLVHPDDLPQVLRTIQDHLDGRIERYQIEYRMRRKDGEWVWILDRGAIAARDASGRPVRVTGTHSDITERKRAEQAEAEQRILAEALRDAAATLNSTLELDEVLDRILHNAARVVPHDAATIMIIDEGYVRIVRSQGYIERGLTHYVDTYRYPVADLPNLRRMSETGRPLSIPDVQSFPAWVDFPEIRWLRSYAGAPIRVRGQTVGFINLDSETPNFFNQTHAERLQAFADQAGAAIDNARLYAEKARLAITDDLTKVLNRRGLFEAGQREVERAHRYFHPLCAVFIDIDHFRQFNKKFGHHIGDDVLQMVTGKIRQLVRVVDLVGRYGGEELVILLPETPLGAATQVAERLRQTVQETKLITEFGELGVTISVGVSQLQPHMTDLGEVIDRADAAMLSAKRAGRNQVVVK